MSLSLPFHFPFTSLSLPFHFPFTSLSFLQPSEGSFVSISQRAPSFRIVVFSFRRCKIRNTFSVTNHLKTTWCRSCCRVLSFVAKLVAKASFSRCISSQKLPNHVFTSKCFGSAIHILKGPVRIRMEYNRVSTR